MMTADEMFEKLGYKKDIDNEFETEYIFHDIYIDFDKGNKLIEKGTYFDNSYIAKDITMQELQAINQKCKELGWLDD